MKRPNTIISLHHSFFPIFWLIRLLTTKTGRCKDAIVPWIRYGGMVVVLFQAMIPRWVFFGAKFSREKNHQVIHLGQTLRLPGAFNPFWVRELIWEASWKWNDTYTKTVSILVIIQICISLFCVLWFVLIDVLIYILTVANTYMFKFTYRSYIGMSKQYLHNYVWYISILYYMSSE